jgi:hypothetical protein
MPLLESINGINIHVYNGEHRPAHIHAAYNEYEILIEIESRQIYAGNMQNRQMKTIYDWLSDNSGWALSVFYELNPDLK